MVTTIIFSFLATLGVFLGCVFIGIAIFFASLIILWLDRDPWGRVLEWRMERLKKAGRV